MAPSNLDLTMAEILRKATPDDLKEYKKFMGMCKSSHDLPLTHYVSPGLPADVADHPLFSDSNRQAWVDISKYKEFIRRRLRFSGSEARCVPLRWISFTLLTYIHISDSSRTPEDEDDVIELSMSDDDTPPTPSASRKRRGPEILGGPPAPRSVKLGFQHSAAAKKRRVQTEPHEVIEILDSDEEDQVKTPKVCI